MSNTPSSPSSRAQTPVLNQSNQNSRTSQGSDGNNSPVRSRSSTGSQNSSAGPQLTSSWIANSGLVINGEINGVRLQVVFSMIHKSDWMTQTTAQRLGIMGERIQGDNYLERTYFDHKYSQRTRNELDIRIGQDANGRDIYIRTDDRALIVDDSNFYHRSQSLREPRNRIFFVIGWDTIQSNGIQIRLKPDKSDILVPNPNYQAPTENKFYKLKAMRYPDLSDQRNRDFNISNINQS
jgi:hypothetical protein